MRDTQHDGVEQLERGGRHAGVVGGTVPLDEREGLFGVPLPHQYERPAAAIVEYRVGNAAT
jgi:hypothetical protein